MRGEKTRLLIKSLYIGVISVDLCYLLCDVQLFRHYN